MAVKSDEVDEAVVLYIGRGITKFPKEDAGRVLDRFGPARGPELVDRVAALVTELRGIQPDWNRHTLVTASRWAAAQMAERHPELDEPAISALEWIYSWWWK